MTIDHSCKIFFWYWPNWTSTDLWCSVLNVTYSTTHQRSVEVQFGRYQKNILQEWFMFKNLSCVSYGSLKRFPHTFTTLRHKLQMPDPPRSPLKPIWSDCLLAVLIKLTPCDPPYVDCAFVKNLILLGYLRMAMNKWKKFIFLFGDKTLNQCTEVRFASFLSGGFTAMAVINPK